MVSTASHGVSTVSRAARARITVEASLEHARPLFVHKKLDHSEVVSRYREGPQQRLEVVG